jgi:hypothetical protein
MLDLSYTGWFLVEDVTYYCAKKGEMPPTLDGRISLAYLTDWDW